MPGQEKQAFHKLLHAGRLLRDSGDTLVQHLLIRFAPALQHAHIALDHRDRRPQLMRRVAYKLLLAVVAQLNTVKHPVDNQRQVLQLVLGSLHADAVAQVVGAKGCRGLSHIGNGLKHLPVQTVSVAQKIAHPVKVQAKQSPEKNRCHIDQLFKRKNCDQPALGGVGVKQNAVITPASKIGKHQPQPPAPRTRAVVQQLVRQIGLAYRKAFELRLAVTHAIRRLHQAQLVHGLIRRGNLRHTKRKHRNRQYQQRAEHELPRIMQRYPQRQRKPEVAQQLG